MSGACEREEGRKEESFSEQVFCYFQSAKCHWRLPLWKHIFKIRISEKGWDLFRDWTSQGTQAKSRITQLKGMSKLVPSLLSSRFLVFQILLEWPFGLPQGFSTLTPPTCRFCPGRALADGFANSSGHPKDDFTRVGFDSVSCP